MAFSLPNPTSPTNGQSLDATPILANEVAIAEAIASFDGSQIQAASITAASFNANINPNTLLKETTVPFVASGLIWSVVSGLAGGMTSGVLYYNGIRIPVNSISSHTFTASKDTYIDIDVNGNVTYVAVNNGATSGMTLTTNSIRVALVVTSGSAITSTTQTGIDPLNNQIYPNNASLPLNWLSYTPTVVNITVGNGTLTGRYIQIGKTVFGRVEFTLGSTSAVGTSPTFSIPVTAVTLATTESIGFATFLDSGNFLYDGFLYLSSTTVAAITAKDATSTYVRNVGVTATAPFTFGTSDAIYLYFHYEAQ